MKVYIGKYPKTGEPRKTEVRIDSEDLWNADHTMSLIIHPILEKLKDAKIGAPGVDDEDVPEEIRSTSAKAKENEWDLDEFWFDRWNYILSEMAWAFGEIKSADWESQYFKNGFDQEGYKKHNTRMNNGTMLFGKYYRALWT